jgi:hypothetical protein
MTTLRHVLWIGGPSAGKTTVATGRARRQGLPTACDVNVLRVDDTVGVDEALAAVEEMFADALAEGPCTETLDERQALLRFANEAIVEQARGYLARPWSTGDEASFLRELLCECGDPECTESVVLAIADFEPGISAHEV